MRDGHYLRTGSYRHSSENLDISSLQQVLCSFTEQPVVIDQ